MREIVCHSFQYRPTMHHAWRVLCTSRNPVLTSVLDLLPDLILCNGVGFYRIVRNFSDNSWSIILGISFDDTVPHTLQNSLLD